jgi:hypothetical protein
MAMMDMGDRAFGVHLDTASRQSWSADLQSAFGVDYSYGSKKTNRSHKPAETRRSVAVPGCIRAFASFRLRNPVPVFTTTLAAEPTKLC